MPSYRVHRLRKHLRDSFRSAPHVRGTANVKPRDYELEETADAVSAYAAFFLLKETGTPLHPGDVLEAVEDGSLRIYKFVGFEEAIWVLPEPKADTTAECAAEIEEVLVRL